MSTIRSIELWHLSVPCEPHRPRGNGRDDPFNLAVHSPKGMESMVVLVSTDDGIDGWGEAFGHGSNPAVWESLRRLVASLFIGKDSAEFKSLLQKAEKALHGFGRTGPVHYALSAIDIALWDIEAQRQGVPLYKLFESNEIVVPTYPSLPAYQSELALISVIDQLRKDGFWQIKLHEIDVELVSKIRTAVGSSIELMLDVNCIWTREEAEEVLSQLQSVNLTWLEEPLWPPDDLNGLASLRGKGTRIAAGENASGYMGLIQHLAWSCADVIQPSVSKIGGITPFAQLIDISRSHPSVQVMPHCFYIGPGLLATAHMVSVLNSRGKNAALEIPWFNYSCQIHDWMNFSPKMTLPNRPGLGFSPDKKLFEHCTVAHLTLT